MINKYKFDRTEIILLIKNAPQTRDGFFYYPKFNDINEEKGYISDNDYFYKRIFFKNKFYFSQKDLYLFLTKKQDKKINEFEFIKKTNNFKKIFLSFKHLNLKEKPPNEKYTIEEMIDTFEFIQN